MENVVTKIDDSPIGLTIAGFDPSGGAGIIADIRALIHFNCVPVAAVTSLTFQNSKSISGAAHQTAETVRAQVMSLLATNSIAAVKTGMLPTREIIREVTRLFRETDLPAPVVDPVMRSTSGYDLMTEDAWESLLQELMPLARVITPNIPEAERITGRQIVNEEEMRRAAAQIRQMGARAVLVKGGHLGERGSSPTVREGSTQSVGPAQSNRSHQAIDVLDDEGEVTIFRGDWIEGPPMRGTGCMLSAGIAACLAKGLSLKQSVSAAKHYVAGESAKGKELRAKG
jgi:hydroxymethylpyrimidine kinase/phosphomethylpyrimidine kinase